jgi:hypothetical protein
VTDSFWRDPPWRGGKGGYRMGLRPIETKDWLPDRISAPDRDRKRALLSDPSSGVFAALENSFAGQRKILDEVTRFASLSGPAHSVESSDEIGREAARIARSPAATDLTDAAIDCSGSERDAASAPIVRASLLVPDDLCLMEEHDGLYRLTAACVCSPSYWRLADKIGRGLDGIHAPVPTLNDKLAASMRQFFVRLPNDAVFERRNWLIHTNAEFYQPTSDAWHHIDAGEVAALIVRSERQTLKRLDATTIVFTIRVSCHPLGEIAGHREAARDLLDALHALDDAERAAKGYEFFAPAVVDYLSHIG